MLAGFLSACSFGLDDVKTEMSFAVVDVGIPCKANPGDGESLRKKTKRIGVDFII